MEKRRAIFLTGATGLVGSHLLKTFLEHGYKAYVLARGKNYRCAKERVRSVVSFWDKRVLTKNSGNLFVFEGDITKKGLGLNGKQKKILSDNIDEIFHAAAITDLNRPSPEIQKVNVEGTRNVLELAYATHKNTRVFKVNHISTAYLYGDFKGVFNEGDLEVGQKFSNNYEESKFKAELLVEAYRRKGLWVDIYRPSIVIGNSKTGKTFQFKHIYQFIQLCRMELFDALPVRNSSVSLVPIDLLSEAIYKICLNTKERNKTYHPFPNELISIPSIINLAAGLLDFKKPKFIALEDFNLKALTPAQRAILKNTILSVNMKINLGSGFTNAALKKLGFVFPEINKRMLAKALRYFIGKKT